MTEAAFAIAAVLVLFLVAIPTTTIGAKLLLVAQRRRAPEITSYGSTRGYLYVTAPVLLPCLWVVSAALHQSEPGGALAACLEHHLFGSICIGALSLAVVITLGAGAAAVRVPGMKGPTRPTTDAARRQQDRAESCSAKDPLLRSWVSRIVVVDGDAPAACVRGLVRPRIELSAAFLSHIDDDMLRAVLLHEIEHVVCCDPLRGFLAEVAMRLNPLGFLLRAEFARWRLAREVACDRHAITLGADRAALAEALVSGARFPGGMSVAPGVHSSERDALELRVRLLLEDSGPACACGSRRGVFGALAIVVVIAAAPHVLGSEPLDSFHLAVDRTAHRVLE